MERDITGVLRQLAEAVVEEAERDERFARKIEEILGGKSAAKAEKPDGPKPPRVGRPSNRRDPAVLDPIALVSEDEALLVERLQGLTDKQLKDIVADYGMDPSKLAMKWKNRDRLIAFIVDAARRRASKGDAFREKSGDQTRHPSSGEGGAPQII